MWLGLLEEATGMQDEWLWRCRAAASTCKNTSWAWLIEDNSGWVSGTAIQHTLVLVIPVQKLLLDLSLLFFLFGLYEKKRKTKSTTAGQQLSTRAWQTFPCFLFFFFFLRNCYVSPNRKHSKHSLLFCGVVQCKSSTKSMKMCLEVLKVERKKNRKKVHVYAHDQCQASLSVGWLVCACIIQFFMKWWPFFLFWQF